MRIRKMNAEDIPAVAELERLVFSLPWSKKSLEESYRQPCYYFLVAEDKDKITGYMGLYVVMQEGNVTNVAVHPEEQHRGIGKALVKHAMEFCQQEGLDSVTLEVRVSNQAAISLYGKFGFQIVGTRPKFYEKPLEDAIIMRSDKRN